MNNKSLALTIVVLILNLSRTGICDNNAHAEMLRHGAGMVAIWEPRLPHEIAAEFDAPMELVRWFEAWERLLEKGGSGSETKVLELEKLLGANRLSADQCVLLVKTVQNWDEIPALGREAAYKPVTGAIACEAIHAAVRESHSDANHYQAQMQMVAPLIQRLWHGRERDARAVEAFYTMLVTFNPPGSPDHTRGRLGAAEAMGIQGRHAEAIAGFDRLLADLPDADEALRIKINFDKGVCLYQSQDFRSAATALEPAADSADFVGRRYARELLMQSRAKLGDEHAAALDLGKYIRDYSLPTTQANAWVEVIKLDLIRAKQLSSSR